MEPREESIGTYLRRTRERRDISVAEIARATGYPSSAIARFEDVLARYTAARRVVSVEPLPMATPVARSGSRRYGVAIAFLLLLVLFTLALSIVLRPRGHDRPQELSTVTPTTWVGDGTAA